MAAQSRYDFTAEGLETALSLTGRLLAERGQSYEVVVIGGANLLLRGFISRTTVDVDVVALREDDDGAFVCARPLPDALDRAVQDVAMILGLPPRWLNGAASSDFELGLPQRYESRLEVRHYDGLKVAFAARMDIVAWKLQAAVDQWGTKNRHLDDLRRLRPTPEEVAAARDWFTRVETAHSAFWINLEAVLEELRRD